MAEPHELELLPCPFCGRSDLIVIAMKVGNDNREYAKTVLCRDCHCHGRHHYRIGWTESDRAAREAWNDRLSHTAPQAAEIERLNSAVRSRNGEVRNLSEMLANEATRGDVAEARTADLLKALERAASRLNTAAQSLRAVGESTKGNAVDTWANEARAAAKGAA